MKDNKLREKLACRGDTWVWYCLTCNNIDADRIN
jgi:hypothetical protein